MKILKILAIKAAKAPTSPITGASHHSWALVDQSMVSGTNFLTGILFARFLGIAEFGRFTLVWMVVLFVNSIQMAMISAPMMSIGPKQPEHELPTYYGAVIIQQACFGLLSFIFIYMGVKLSQLIYPQWHISQLALPLAAVVIFFQSQDFMRRLFFTQNRPVTAFINDAISYLGQIVLLIALFLAPNLNIMKFLPAIFVPYLHVDTAAVLWVISVTSALAVLVDIRFLGDIVWDFTHFKLTFIRHWRFSKWLTASSLLQWTSGNLFIIAAGGIIGAVAVGALKTAQNIMGICHIMFQGLENIVPVNAGRFYAQTGIAGMSSYLRKVALWGGILTGVIGLIAASYPEKWLYLLCGNEYQGYGFVLRGYAIIYFLVFIGLPIRAGLRALETTKFIFVAYLFATLFALMTANLLITYLGIWGALLGMLGTQLILQGISFAGLFHVTKKKVVPQ